ncbi:MAG: phosphocholine cytidylyltransferase family protein [Candidatus Pacebacteria bacterium]|nr:phosphocholine cytidylyltransferase family protein [Candidatus Paceibacterota bacterium]
MKAIILAAGMGTRLGKYAKNLPKGMLRFFGKTLIERQIEVLRKCGINDIVIVKGYMSDKINFGGIKYYTNNNFANTNMVETLFRAEQEMDTDFLVLYSDIIYEKKVLLEVLKSRVDIGVTADIDYKDYWKARLDNPKIDTESFKLGEGGEIVDIGNPNCSFSDVEARYVGIIKVSKKGAEIFKKNYKLNRDKYYNSDLFWMRSKNFKNAYMTCFLKAIVDSGFKVYPIFIKRGWLEFDTVEDYEKSTMWVKNGSVVRFIDLTDL